MGPPSKWITDQSWYLHLWRFDPTIHAMLVTLDAIAERFGSEDIEELWARLTDDAKPAIWFQLLPIDEMGTAEDLYIKMNSRGKPLTAFEAFKAHLGQLVAEAGVADDFGHKIDGVWTDLFWPYRGDNDIVDDEFMRYFDFLIEVCEWREGRVRGEDVLTPEQRISALLSTSNAAPPRTSRRSSAQPSTSGSATSRSLRSSPNSSRPPSRATACGSSERPPRTSFTPAATGTATTRGTTRMFSLTDTLLLFAVLMHRIHETDDASARLRSLRNVNEASQFEMRVQNMPKFIAGGRGIHAERGPRESLHLQPESSRR